MVPRTINTLPLDDTAETRCWVLLELLRARYDMPLIDLLLLFDLSLDQVRAYEPTWRQAVRYAGPSLLPTQEEE